MTANDFRKLALSLPETIEAEHMDHPDFRVGGKIFATLGYPDNTCGMVALSPELQQQFLLEDSDAFFAVKGAWGKGGATCVRLAKAKRAIVRSALAAAWKTRAPKRISKEHDVDE